MSTRTLQSELKKTEPFASPAQEAALAILRTGDRLSLRFARLFRGHGLTPSQYNILRILRGAGEPLPILEIAQRTITVVPGITGLIDRLESAGWVQRTRCAADRRVIYVALTTAGTRILRQLDQPVLDLHARIMQSIPEPDLRRLIATLELIRGQIDDPVEPEPDHPPPPQKSPRHTKSSPKTEHRKPKTSTPNEP